jgi:hypothetical protein
MSLEAQTKNYKCSLNLKNKGTKQRTREEKEWYFVSIFVSRPPLLLRIISCSFFIHFEWFQRLQMQYLKIYKICLKWKIKKIIVEQLKLQNHIEHLWKNPKHNPLHFKRAYLAHFPLDCSIFYIFGYSRWRITKLFSVSKGTNHGQESYNDPILLSVWW